MPRLFSKLSGMTIVRCDFAHDVVYVGEGACGEEFRSASATAVIEKQLLAAGWRRRRDAKRPHVDADYICPIHAERLHLNGVRMP